MSAENQETPIEETSEQTVSATDKRFYRWNVSVSGGEEIQVTAVNGESARALYAKRFGVKDQSKITAEPVT